MGVYRLYSGDDGQSHIEELSEDAIKEIKLDRSRMNFNVSQREPGHFSDYHPAPRRRWQIGVVGRTIIGFGDGTSHTFIPGDVRLIEDLTGQEICDAVVEMHQRLFGLWHESEPSKMRQQLFWTR